MYNLAQIKRVGLIHIVGGLLVMLAGILSEFLLRQSELLPTIFNNLVSTVLFGSGWYLFNQLIIAQTFNNVRKGVNFNTLPLDSLDELPRRPRRFGLDYLPLEILSMLFAVVLVVIVTGLAGNGGGFSLGGFAAGWLAGGGLGRIRFARKVRAEELEQERAFYFSDATAGPRTSISFYEENPGKRTREEATRPASLAKTTSEAFLPPGVRRRAGEGSPGKAGQVRKSARVLPKENESNPEPGKRA